MCHGHNKIVCCVTSQSVGYAAKMTCSLLWPCFLSPVFKEAWSRLGEANSRMGDAVLTPSKREQLQSELPKK